jgi:hypothetical protein
MSKPTKIDAHTWCYRGYTIVRCTHSRTYIITEPERRPGSHRRLSNAKDEIDFIYYRRDVAAAAPQPDPDADENVTLTVSLNQARTILAALSDRHDVVQGRFKEEAGLGLLTAAARTEALVSEVKATYQSVDRQVFQAK